MDSKVYSDYVAILKEELVPALGCTEPIAIAYAAAKAAETLGSAPEKLIVTCSGNIVKNVKGVTVPNSNGMRGIDAAAALGALGGDASRELEVLQSVTEASIAQAQAFIDAGCCECVLSDTEKNLYITVQADGGGHSALVEIQDGHTNITCIKKDGVVLLSKESGAPAAEQPAVDKTLLNVKDILAFADAVELEDVQGVLDRQITLNTAISEEGLKHHYGAEIGQGLLHYGGDDVSVRARAKAAAGSDARMSGCSMPVVINSGSGNQGLTVSLPVIEYANENKQPREKLYRALVVANLISVHLKRYIGNLSAFCGATSAGCGAACGIAYLSGCTYEQICMTITNTLCNIGGMVCDGAKPSCAAKIASAVDAGIMGYRMALDGRTFHSGEGLAGNDIEQTIENFGRVGRDGMRSTDIEILNVMIGK